MSFSSAQKMARNRLDCCQAQAVDLNCYLGLLRPAEHLPRNRKGRDRFRAPGCFDATNHQIKRARQNSQIEWERKRDRREKKKTPTNEESEKHGEMKYRRLFLEGSIGLAIVESERHHEQAAGSHWDPLRPCPWYHLQILRRLFHAAGSCPPWRGFCSGIPRSPDDR